MKKTVLVLLLVLALASSLMLVGCGEPGEPIEEDMNEMDEFDDLGAVELEVEEIVLEDGYSLQIL